jgi:hypothetical protein
VSPLEYWGAYSNVSGIWGTDPSDLSGTLQGLHTNSSESQAPAGHTDELEKETSDEIRGGGRDPKGKSWDTAVGEVSKQRRRNWNSTEQRP